MALQNSGVISFSDINTELGNSSSAQLNLGGSDARTLAGVSSGAISLSDFYGASSGPVPVTGVNFTSTNNGATIGNATVNGSNVSSNYFGPSAYSLSMSTSGSWTAVGSIFNNNSNVNSINRSSKSSSSGSTFSGGGSSGSPFHIVIDLGQERVFNQARYYQMFSDGKTTHAAMDISSSGSLETYSSGNWTQVHGFNVLDNSSTSTGIAVNFSNKTARYIRLRIYNDGRYGNGSYTELYNIKLFYV